MKRCAVYSPPIKVSGRATSSRAFRSASTPQRQAIQPAIIISAEPRRYPQNTLTRDPVSIRSPNKDGAKMPPIPVPTA